MTADPLSLLQRIRVVPHIVLDAEILAGAGTILTPQQAAEAKAAGAQFVVSPGFNPRVVDYCQEHDIPISAVCRITER
jgi:2-keto-3-deoxy-6-phosphogluconate aldolase